MTPETITMLIILAALQVADALTTIKALALGGREANPVIRAAMDLLGVKPALVLKGVVVVGTAWHMPVEFLQGMMAIYIAVVAWNLRVIRKLKVRQ